MFKPKIIHLFTEKSTFENVLLVFSFKVQIKYQKPKEFRLLKFSYLNTTVSCIFIVNLDDAYQFELDIINLDKVEERLGLIMDSPGGEAIEISEVCEVSNKGDALKYVMQ